MKEWGTISNFDSDLFHITDSCEEGVQLITDFYSNEDPKPNFYF